MLQFSVEDLEALKEERVKRLRVLVAPILWSAKIPHSREEVEDKIQRRENQEVEDKIQRRERGVRPKKGEREEFGQRKGREEFDQRRDAREEDKYTNP